MQRRTFLQSSAAAAALTAIPLGASALTNTPMAKSYRSILGHDMAYVDQGSGRPVVFLHGNPASSYLWRNIIPYVTDSHRAIAPDLIGMGDSDKPVLTDTYAESAAHLHGLLDELDLRDAVLVIHDWGSALGWHYARTRPERISAICFMEAMTPPFMPIASYSAMGPNEEFIRGINTPGVGEEMILNQNVFLDQFMKHGSPNGPLADDIMAEYNRYYPTPESRQILLDWPREIPIAGEPADVHEVVKANSEWLLTTQFPKLMFHVDPGAIIPLELAEILRVRPGTLCRITEFSEHESNGRELDEGERVAVEVLPVLGQSAAAVEPGDGAFDHPTPGLDDEALHPIGSLDDLGLEIGQDAGQGAVKDRPLIGAVGEQFPEKGKQTEQGRQQRETAVAILNVGGGDDAVQQQALRIDQNMPLLALDQLAGIEAVAVDASPPFSALFTL